MLQKVWNCQRGNEEVFLQNVKTGSEAHPGYQGARSAGLKWPGREADYCGAEECLVLYLRAPIHLNGVCRGQLYLSKK